MTKKKKKSLGSHAGEGAVMEEGLCGPVQSQTERKHKSESKPVPNVSGGRTLERDLHTPSQHSLSGVKLKLLIRFLFLLRSNKRLL